MTTRKKKMTTFIVKKFPYNHETAGLVPVGAEVDLSHLPHEKIQPLINRRLMEPVGEYVPVLPKPKQVPVLLNKHGKPYGSDMATTDTDPAETAEDNKTDQ